MENLKQGVSYVKLSNVPTRIKFDDFSKELHLFKEMNGASSLVELFPKFMLERGAITEHECRQIERNTRASGGLSISTYKVEPDTEEQTVCLNDVRTSIPQRVFPELRKLYSCRVMGHLSFPEWLNRYGHISDEEFRAMTANDPYKHLKHDPYKHLKQDPPVSSAVDHPAHYGGEDNPYEAIKVIEAWDLDFNLGNTVKYISRAGKKDQTKLKEDLTKAMWYLKRKIDSL